MSLIAYKRLGSDEVRLLSAPHLEVYPVGIALLERGDEIISITPNRDEHPINIEQVISAKANRDQQLVQGIPCEALPVLP